ncbi:MAG: D-alanyl-D-alanine endopeptidase [Rhodocyclaceae bacterium]|nr:D-alanyl-D-alanine endopeptidase [Rhodocyclaceae bacterium]
MKPKFRIAMIVGALLGVMLSGSGGAVTAKKEQSATPKKATQVAAKSASKEASKTRHKSPAKSVTKTAASKGVSKTAANKATSRKFAKAPVVAAQKPTRKVSFHDVDPDRLALYSASALVIDQVSGQPLLDKNSHEIVPIASISKLMTAMVVLDAELDLNEVISVSEDDIDSLKGTRSRLPVGTTMTRETAMLLALMSSENRAANALGRHYPGGLSAFVVAMNQKAQSLGMNSSHFEEPTGLSSNNVSTARDLARMVAAAARYPEIRSFSTTAEAKVEIHGRVRNFGNTNALVRSDNWEIGLSKTGYISEAGRCLVMQARVADKPVVIVLLDSVGKMSRVGDANRIKRWMESAGLQQERKPA